MRCWTGSRKTCGGCCCAPACWSGCPARWPMPWPEARAGSGCCRSWRRRTRSWPRWTRAVPGSVTITCSPTCCSWSCGAPRRGRSPGCTGWQRSGFLSTGSRWRRSGTRRRRGTGGWPPACSPGTGLACIWAGRPRRYTRSWPGSRRGPRRRMLSWRRWRRPMSWRRDRWRPRSGIWRGRRAGRRRCRRPGAGRRRCCSGSSGCWLPATAGTRRRWRRRRGGCRPRPRLRRRRPAWARSCARWR